MRFTNPKRRQPPPVIIISLIDVLIIMLIFLMVTTTFKQQPAMRIALPEAKRPAEGVAEGNLIVTIPKSDSTNSPFYLGPIPVTFDRLQDELIAHKQKNPNVTLSIRGDDESALGKLVLVIEAAKIAGIKSYNLHVKNPGQP